jgi:hypothetical protein
MARHRVGDSYLSDNELAQHYRENWILAVFACGAIGGGGVAVYLLDPEWAKWLRFSIIILSAIVGGCVLSYFNRILARLTLISIFIGVLFFIGKFIWLII